VAGKGLNLQSPRNKKKSQRNQKEKENKTKE
jgi:hypothetical protein